MKVEGVPVVHHDARNIVQLGIVSFCEHKAQWSTDNDISIINLCFPHGTLPLTNTPHCFVLSLTHIVQILLSLTKHFVSCSEWIDWRCQFITNVEWFRFPFMRWMLFPYSVDSSILYFPIILACYCAVNRLIHSSVMNTYPSVSYICGVQD